MEYTLYTTNAAILGPVVNPLVTVCSATTVTLHEYICLLFNFFIIIINGCIDIEKRCG
jgi:hypothetical protein